MHAMYVSMASLISDCANGARTFGKKVAGDHPQRAILYATFEMKKKSLKANAKLPRTSH